MTAIPFEPSVPPPGDQEIPAADPGLGAPEPESGFSLGDHLDDDVTES